MAEEENALRFASSISRSAREKKVDLDKVVEAALFIAGKRLSLEDLSAFTGKTPIPRLKTAIEHIKKDYSSRGSPIELTDENETYKLDLKPEYLDYVKNLAPQMDMRKAVLTTLSYIAFKQPITQSKLVKLFGNRIYDYVKELVQRNLIKAVPYKRTRMITTTKKLVTYLGQEDIKKIKSVSIEGIEKQLKQEIAVEDKKEKEQKIDELKQLEQKKDLSVDEWEQLIEKRKQREIEKAEKRAKRRRPKPQDAPKI